MHAAYVFLGWARLTNVSSVLIWGLVCLVPGLGVFVASGGGVTSMLIAGVLLLLIGAWMRWPEGYNPDPPPPRPDV
jgi:hypothetical protein